MNHKRGPSDPRNNLVLEYARMIVEIQPKTFVMENVPDVATMLTPEGIPILDEFCRIIADGGFGAIDGVRKMLKDTSGLGAVVSTSNRRSKIRNRKSK